MPSSFLARQPAKKKCKQERIFTYERDIVCLSKWYRKKMTGNCIPIPRGDRHRQYLAKHGLMGKIKLSSDMDELKIFREICSVFSDSFGHDDFRLQILQPIGGFSKALTIPQVSHQYKWSASSVAGKKGKVPIYILALEPLKVRMCIASVVLQ